MAYTHYDRLTALDSMFLDLEDANVHMHVGAVGIFDAAPLRRADGGLDIDRILTMSEAALRKTPRFRQKLRYIPLFGRPVWVDDERFNLLYHVRHTSLPHPGDVRQLKRLAGRIMSQKLDRGKPLWEMWFVEGLEGNRFAVITKAHHCMIDGVSGVDLLAALMTVEPHSAVSLPHAWVPRPAPSPASLLIDEVLRRSAIPAAALAAVPQLLRDPGAFLENLRDAVEGVGEALLAGLAPASPTPLNVEIGPHRRFDWWQCDVDTVRQIKQQLGGTLNDVVVAVVAGTLRRFLKERGLDVKHLDVRAMMPVSVRGRGERGALGNRVSFLMADLPVEERDPVARLRKVIKTTQDLKQSNKVHGTEILEEISDWTFSGLFIELSRLAATTRSYNLVVTNVPGPQFPVYMLGASMLDIYPLVPLFTNQALGIALFSYNGKLYWGFNADRESLPDLHDIVDALAAELKALSAAAAALSASKAPVPSPAPKRPKAKPLPRRASKKSRAA